MRRKYLHGKRFGLTLIEVVVGLAIAGALLSAVIIVSSHHAKQMRLSARKRAAVELADRFLARWAHYNFRDVDKERALADLASQVASVSSRSLAVHVEQMAGGTQLAKQSSSLQPDDTPRLGIVRVSVQDAAGQKVTHVDIARLGAQN